MSRLYFRDADPGAGGPGDIAGAIVDFGLPGWVAITGFILGSIGTLSLSYLFCFEVRPSGETPDEMRALGIFPWLVGTAIMVAVGLVINLTSQQNLSGAELFLVLLGSFAALIFAPMFTFFIKRVSYKGLAEPPLPSVAPFAFFALVLAIQLFHAYVNVRLGG